ncbi:MULTISPECIES: putative transporter small subunit [unclassified Halomonas]|nr:MULTISPECIES: putative transporter small subunit [unclassified Halomonas]MDT0501416.1 putative transporter small subunit [Halomonas sp. PAR7]MDT0512910.1 putative transporter small subunit [Halomonas sp. LES1]MDT0591265.1 putative transporter small subunit [Halomonas sp. PAR8]
MTTLFTFYVLIWPALTLGVLTLICRAVIRDRRKAQEENRELV